MSGSPSATSAMMRRLEERRADGGAAAAAAAASRPVVRQPSMGSIERQPSMSSPRHRWHQKGGAPGPARSQPSRAAATAGAASVAAALKSERPEDEDVLRLWKEKEEEKLRVEREEEEHRQQMEQLRLAQLRLAEQAQQRRRQEEQERARQQRDEGPRGAAADGDQAGLDLSPLSRVEAEQEDRAARVESVMRNIELFRVFKSAKRADFASAMRFMEVGAGEDIIKEGTQGDAFYIVEHGQARVSKLDEHGESQDLVTLGPGKHFGELALLDNSPRAATVTALTGVSLLVLARDDFTRILGPMVRSQAPSLTRRISHRLCIAHVLPFSGKFLREQTVR